MIAATTSSVEASIVGVEMSTRLGRYRRRSFQQDNIAIRVAGAKEMRVGR